MRRNTFITLVAAIFVEAYLTPAMAHHSFAMFDQTKTITLRGTVSKFEWGNPHVFVVVTAMVNGNAVPHPLEGSSPSLMRHAGWKFDSIKVGDQVEVTVHPFKDGKLGGMLVTVKLPSGETLNGW